MAVVSTGLLKGLYNAVALAKLECRAQLLRASGEDSDWGRGFMRRKGVAAELICELRDSRVDDTSCVLWGVGMRGGAEAVRIS